MVDARGQRGLAPFAVIEVDAALRVVDWDERAALEFGVGPAEAIGRPIAEVVPIAGGEAAWRGVLVEDDAARAWATGERVFEWLHRCVYAADGSPRGAVCYGRDVTARLAAERERVVEHQLLAAIAAHMSVALWAIDERGVFVYQDGRASRAPPRSMLGMNAFEVMQPDGLADVRAVLAGELRHNRMELAGQDWESWLIPVHERVPGGPAMIGVSLDVTEMRRSEQELRDKLGVIERQQQAIRAMSTPIIEVWEGVLTLPILGLVDSVRTAEIMDNLLTAVTQRRARFAVLDMTGVEVIDTSTAGHLLGMIRAIRLLGAEGIITGIHPNIAQTMVTLGVDLSRMVVHANLREALKYCITRSRPRAGG
jgi:rsbT co-antagonist protein RsbR